MAFYPNFYKSNQSTEHLGVLPSRYQSDLEKLKPEFWEIQKLEAWQQPIAFAQLAKKRQVYISLTRKSFDAWVKKHSFKELAEKRKVKKTRRKQITKIPVKPFKPHEICPRCQFQNAWLIASKGQKDVLQICYVRCQHIHKLVFLIKTVELFGKYPTKN